MRTADSVGAHGIIIPKRRSVGLTQTVAKASTGAMEYVPVVRVTNMVRTMEELQKRGLWILEQMRKVVAITGRWMWICRLLLLLVVKVLE